MAQFLPPPIGTNMRKIFSDLSGTALAVVVFWLTGGLFLRVVAMAWPMDASGGDLPLKSQHLPSMARNGVKPRPCILFLSLTEIEVEA
jgi:hypothetical protein